MNIFKKSVTVLCLVCLLLTFLGLTPINSVEAADDYTISGWEYHSTVNYTTIVEKIAVVGASLLVTNYVLAPWTGLKTIVQFATSVYTITSGKNLWVSAVTSRKYAEIEGTFRPIAAEKTDYVYYANSNRTDYVGSTSLTATTSWYK